MLTFTPLYHGTIWRLFEWKPPATTFVDPRALPQVESQCVHVDCTYIDILDGSQVVIKAKRCVKDSTIGFLCGKHDWQTLSPKVGVNKVSRDPDLEVSEGIIKYETRALQASEVESTVIGRTTIRTVKGFVGKPINPNDYAEYDHLQPIVYED